MKLLPFVSVIIPVLHDAEVLRGCLEVLEQQTYPRDRYEILVVDNGASAAIAALCDLLPHCRYLQETQRGSYAARNHGITAATGEVLAFTDADCLPARDWLEKGVQALLEHPHCGLVAGRIEVFARHDPLTPAERYELLYAFRQENYINTGHYGATANVFTRRTVMDSVGFFRGDLQSGGDMEWGERVYAHGYAQHYAPDATVKHPARATFAELQEKNLRVTRGAFARGDRTPAFQPWRLILRPPLKNILRILRQPLPLSERLSVSSILLGLHYGRALELFKSRAQAREQNSSRTPNTKE